MNRSTSITFDVRGGVFSRSVNSVGASKSSLVVVGCRAVVSSVRAGVLGECTESDDEEGEEEEETVKCEFDE